MAIFDLPELPESRVSPQLMLGAASPLWAYFGAAAAGGVAYWWMTRWTRPVNLEALFDGAIAAEEALAPVIAAAEPVVEAVEAVAEFSEAAREATVEAVVEVLPDVPVGGEAIPPSALAEAVADVEPASEPLNEAAAEPVVEAVAEFVPDVAPEPALDAAPEPEVEAPPVMEATADPLPAPVARPRVRKTPANGLEA